MNLRSLKYVLFFALLVQVSVLFAGAEIIKISARSEGGNVIVTWETGQETNLQHFVIERKSANGTFTAIATVDPVDNHYYEFTDETAYKTSDNLYIYRLKIVDDDGTITYSGEVSVSHNVSSVKRTWGSIKALFR